VKTFTIPTTPEEVPELCPFCNQEGLHPDIKGKIFTSDKFPKVLACYFCGTYIWVGGIFTIGPACIDPLGIK